MNNLSEQIWKDEFKRWTEDVHALWQTQYALWQRAQSQGAPPALLNELALACNDFQTAYKRLKSIENFFPEETPK